MKTILFISIIVNILFSLITILNKTAVLYSVYGAGWLTYFFIFIYCVILVFSILILIKRGRSSLFPGLIAAMVIEFGFSIYNLVVNYNPAVLGVEIFGKVINFSIILFLIIYWRGVGKKKDVVEIM